MASAANCEKVPTSKVFAAIGDTNDYFLAPGGDFEGKLLAVGRGSHAREGRQREHRHPRCTHHAPLTWKADGPVVQAYTHRALPAAGSTGLVFGAGGSVTSPKVCADLDRPTMRFFAYAPERRGTLRVDALLEHGETVQLGRLDGAAISLNSGLLGFGNLLGLDLDTSKHVQLRLTAESGTWVADAVYIDPYMR